LTQEIPDPQGNPPQPLITDLRFTTSTVVPSYRYDSRDNPFDTTRGSRMSLSLAYAGGPLGGSVEMFKPTVGFTKFHRLSRRSSISANVEGGYIFSFGEDCAHTYDELSNEVPDLCVPTSDRFLVGGEFSVRGFQYGTLDRMRTTPGWGLRPVGGYISHVQLRVPLSRQRPFVSCCLHAGRAYGYQERSTSRSCGTAGAELRLFLPVFQFPLRFIYAINPQEEGTIGSKGSSRLGRRSKRRGITP
jgi:outer membrane protein insertion porin family